MASNQIIKNKSIQRQVPENEKVDVKEVSKVQHLIGVNFVATTTKTEIEQREICDTEDEKHESGRKQKVKGREPINKGKILDGKRETFETEGKNTRRVKKRKEERRKKRKTLITR